MVVGKRDWNCNNERKWQKCVGMNEVECHENERIENDRKKRKWWKEGKERNRYEMVKEKWWKLKYDK